MLVIAGVIEIIIAIAIVGAVILFANKKDNKNTKKQSFLHVLSNFWPSGILAQQDKNKNLTYLFFLNYQGVPFKTHWEEESKVDLNTVWNEDFTRIPLFLESLIQFSGLRGHRCTILDVN